jgi:hypothetical protein
LMQLSFCCCHILEVLEQTSFVWNSLLCVANFFLCANKLCVEFSSLWRIFFRVQTSFVWNSLLCGEFFFVCKQALCGILFFVANFFSCANKLCVEFSSLWRIFLVCKQALGMRFKIVEKIAAAELEGRIDCLYLDVFFLFPRKS